MMRKYLFDASRSRHTHADTHTLPFKTESVSDTHQLGLACIARVFVVQFGAESSVIVFPLEHVR